MHMSKYPTRSWSIILQQAWNLRLRDKLKFEQSGTAAHTSMKGVLPRSGVSQDYCKRYNKGCCTFGQSCHYEHRCYYCGKYGHGVINCRQLKADREVKGDCYHFDQRDKPYRRDDRRGDRHLDEKDRKERDKDGKSKGLQK